MSGAQHIPVACVVLAAGQGTRMKSSKPKVLHEIGGRAMLRHVLDLCRQLGPDRLVTVVGHGGEQVAGAAKAYVPDVAIALQDPPLGTGHAVMAAREPLAGFTGDVFVLFADTPLIRLETLEAMRAARRAGAGVVVLGFEPDDPGAYGRLVVNADGDLEAIVEAKDASPEQLDIRLCNSGVMAFDGARLPELLDKIGNDNAKGEYYLTDCVAIAREAGHSCSVVTGDPSEVLGVNNRVDLSAAEAVFQDRRRHEAMLDGVTMQDPSTVYFSADTVIEADVEIGAHVVFGPHSKIETGAVIRPFCHIEGARVASGATIGPFARLRPGTTVGEDAKIGNFVEVKKAEIGRGAKVSHLSYIGDAILGAEVNVGAGTITCNYDGFDKFVTEIGDGAFIGTNTSLVAPVTIGAGAFTGAGSVITKNVEPDALGVARADQRSVDQWAARFRARKMANTNG